MIILANLTINGETEDYLFTSCPEYYSATFSPEVEINAEVFLGLSGKSYEEKQASARNAASEYSRALPDGYFNDFSWNEIAIINNWFEKVGKRYGLLREFKENALC